MVDAAFNEYRLQPDSPIPALVKGFTSIPFEKIGLQKDEYRK